MYYMAMKISGNANSNASIDLYNPMQYSYVVEDTMFHSFPAICDRVAWSNTLFYYHERKSDLLANASSAFEEETRVFGVGDYHWGAAVPLFHKRMHWETVSKEELVLAE